MRSPATGSVHRGISHLCPTRHHFLSQLMGAHLVCLLVAAVPFLVYVGTLGSDSGSVGTRVW